jgi:hypothetical protein
MGKLASRGTFLIALSDWSARSTTRYALTDEIGRYERGLSADTQHWLCIGVEDVNSPPGRIQHQHIRIKVPAMTAKRRPSAFMVEVRGCTGASGAKPPQPRLRYLRRSSRICYGGTLRRHIALPVSSPIGQFGTSCFTRANKIKGSRPERPCNFPGKGFCL